MGIERALGFSELSDEHKELVRKKAWQPSFLDLVPGVGLARMIVKPYVYHGPVADDARVVALFYQCLTIVGASLYLS